MQELFSGALGWVKGLEPSISRATIWRLSQLGHTHHARGIIIGVVRYKRKRFPKEKAPNFLGAWMREKTCQMMG